MHAQQKLIEEFIELSGLPKDLALKEIATLAHTHGLSLDTLTLMDLRNLLVLYLQDTLLAAKKQYA